MEEKIFPADTADIKISEYDVVEMDLPEYTGEFSHIGDVAAEKSFSADKAEIYRRNREIAAKMQAEALAAKEQEKAEKIAEFESIYEESAAVSDFGHRIKIIIPVLIAVSIVVITILTIMNLVSSLRLDSSEAAAESAAEAAAAMVIPETEAVTRAETTRVTRAETEIVITEEETEIVEEETAEIEDEEAIEILKTTAVREPFNQTGTALVYNTEAMSYKFEPHYKYSNNIPWIKIYVTVKNLTDYDYAVVPNFSITLGETQVYSFRDFNEERPSSYDYSTKWNHLQAEELVDGEWVESEYKFSAFEFDENHIFSLTLEFDAREFGVFENFKYDPQYRINSEYSGRVDEGFEFPFADLAAYIPEDHSDLT